MKRDKALQQAFALHRGGQHQQAEKCYRDILKKHPKDTQVMHLLAGLYVQSQRPEQALPVLKKVLSRQPDFAVAYHTLGMAQRHMGDLEGALKSHLTGVKRGAADPTVFNNIGVVYQDLGQMEQAEAYYRKAVAGQPGYAEALANLGAVLKELRHWQEAETCFRRTLQIQPGHVPTHINIGLLKTEQGAYDEAVASFERALALAPGDPYALVGMAGVQERKGEYEAAYERLLPLIEAGRATPQAIGVFAALSGKVGKRDAAAQLLQSALASPGLDAAAQIRLGFAAGKLHDELKQYDVAFGHYARANDLAKQSQPYDSRVDRARMDQLQAVFSAQGIGMLPQAANRSELPVFIVGMPRSGTSLVEQILASHPQVYGAGELAEIHQMISKITAAGDGSPYPQCMASVPPSTLDELAQTHLEHLKNMARVTTQPSHGSQPSQPSHGPVARVTDKMPHNFMHLGLIARLFPGARVIHTTRDPIDTCLSCYFQHFVGGINYSYDLGHLGQRYQNYQRLMTHWREVLPIKMMEVKYEELVANQEQISREMIDFVGLEWDDACLQFHKTERHVNTASYDQVRQPIYEGSVQRWRHYEAHLDPLKNALEDAP
jgi:tetratricopeptide (TPR) repeat protein